jgi:REP element-mobilizing transposase RayT
MRFEIRKRSRLPHWHASQATYFVTWNLADAIPMAVRRAIEEEHVALLAELERRKDSVTRAERWALRHLIRERTEAALDSGHGDCVLRIPRIAGLVEAALQQFDGERYQLLSRCVMPNHVHVLFTLSADAQLDFVIKSWKGFTARMANRALGRQGAFWQPDYFDRTIRNHDDLLRTASYVQQNPPAAGLSDWPWAYTNWERIGVFTSEK